MIEKLSKTAMAISFVLFIIFGISPVMIGVYYVWQGFFGYGFAYGREMLGFVLLSAISLSFLGLYFLIKKTEILGLIIANLMIMLFVVFEFYQILAGYHPFGFLF